MEEEESAVCHVCGTEYCLDNICRCEKCDELFCENCSAVFTLHNCVDYNCCSSCDNAARWRYDE